MMDNAENFVAATACLQKTTPELQLEYPVDAEEHFHEIRIALAPWAQHSGHQIHPNLGHPGPWIENFWISHFEEKLYDQESNSCLSDHFGPYIPLFIPWVDHWVATPWRYPPGLLETLRSVLRPNVLYITLSQNAEGLTGKNEISMSSIPNILVLSAGGYGHVPVPLFAKPEPRNNYKHPQERKYDLTFVGTMGRAPHRLREVMHEQITNYNNSAEAANTNQSALRYMSYQGPDWRTVMADSRFSLAPRGFGRTAFHIVECMQMGLIPIHLYADIPWIPYADLFPQLGFVNHYDRGFTALLAQLQSLTAQQIVDRETRIVELRDSHFSLEGVMDQIRRFLLNQENDLRCQKLPATVRDEDGSAG